MPGQTLAYYQPIEQRVDELTSGGAPTWAIKILATTRPPSAWPIRLPMCPGNRGADRCRDREQVTGTGQRGFASIRTDRPLRHPTRRARRSNRWASKHLATLEGALISWWCASTRPTATRRSAWADSADRRRGGIPLARLAHFEKVEGASKINRDWGQRRVSVNVNIRSRDQGSFIDEAQKAVKEKVILPSPRYRLEWGGTIEHYQRAKARLWIVVPIALCSIFALLYVTYHSLLDAIRVFFGVPFAAVGGIFALWIRDMPFSISAGVGFIALSGVAVLDDMILVSYIRQLCDKGLSLDEAVAQGATTRLRPVLMTTLVASLGFVPMAFNTGMGAEVQRPLAPVVIGGVLSAMLCRCLFCVIYVVVQSPFERRPSRPRK